jgi:hypothetical protein
MDDKEFTRDLFNLYVRQRKQLDESVPSFVKEKYINKEKKYETQKARQKEKYYENKEKFGEKEYLEKLRIRNKGYAEKKKQKEKEREATHTSSPVSRYAQSFGSDEDLESVFSEEEPKQQQLFKKFIGF